MGVSSGCRRLIGLRRIQKDVRVGHLDGRRNAPLLPVVDALDAALLVVAKQFGNLGGAAKAINEFTVHSNRGVGFHDHIKHYV
ncbi:hypothetical protein D3C81_1139740 [compost metagenome]